MRRLPVLLGVVLIAACAAMTSQKSQPPKSDHLQFKNLKVLPANTTHDELLSTMRGFTKGLGVRCEHCHVETTVDGKEQSDFASDAKPEKTVARTMMRMTANINGSYISTLHEHDQTVTCGTCHRGHTVPEAFVPPAPAPKPGA